MTDLDEIRQQMNLLSDEVLVSILREHDDEQWRPEVFDIVSSILKERGISAGEATGHEEAGLDEPASLDLVTVADYNNYIDAETDRQALEAKGVKAWILNEYVPQMVGPLNDVQLKVRTDDLTTAMEILESELVPSSDLPAEIAEPPCPKCGSRKVTEGAEVVESSAPSIRVPPHQEWLYHCASCGYKWAES